MALYIGMMTGTSLDGLDAVLADFTDTQPPRVVHSVSLDYPKALAADMLALQAGADGLGVNELHRARQAGIALSALHSLALEKLLLESATSAAQISAIGVHGQTVRHLPPSRARAYEISTQAYTAQLIDPARIAEATGCTVVADFRARDIAAGGEGAPLVPAFHALMVQNLAKPVAVVNIGGFANASLIEPSGVRGFDTGPGNVLMDAWAQRHLGAQYDAGGAWAASSAPDANVLATLLSHPFFSQPLPKSTGREAFNLAWLDTILREKFAALSPATVQATLCALTACTILGALQDYGDKLQTLQGIYICGGGAKNATLMAQLAAQAPCPVGSTSVLGVDPQHVEALTFAWLAKCCLARQAIDLSSVTGAAGARVLGAVYYA